MDKNRRKDYEGGRPHRGYSGSDFSPSGDPGRFPGDNFGGTGSYYGAGYDASPYSGDDAERDQRSYSTGLTGPRDSHWESRGRFGNDYNTDERSASYERGRIESNYGRDQYHAGSRRDNDQNDWYGRGSRSGYYGSSGGSDEPYRGGHYGSPYGEYGNDRRSSSGGRNEEGARRGTSGYFTGPGRGGHRSMSEDNFSGPGFDSGRGYGNQEYGRSSSGRNERDRYNENFYDQGRSGWEYGDYRTGHDWRSDEDTRTSGRSGRGSGRSSFDKHPGSPSYGQGRSSQATGGNTSQGSLPGGSIYSDPWL